MNTHLIKPYQNSDKGKQEQIEKMFNNISREYDFLNRLITFGMDKKWRNNVLKLLIEKDPKDILDIATGTGDMAILFSKTNAKNIVGVDISKGMLDIANEKIVRLNLHDRIRTEIQNSEDLKFQNNTFDAVSVTYGIRNFENLFNGLSEIYRVLDENGVLVILETSQPKNKIVRAIYEFYTKQIMPSIAKVFSRDKNAYEYLSNSAIHFPYGTELKEIIQRAGFNGVTVYPQFFGASTIYYATK